MGINNEVEEYLVDFEYLVAELKKLDIILLSNDEKNKIPALRDMTGDLQYSSSNMFENAYRYYYKDAKNHKILDKLDSVEKKLSNMYRFFIFKKKNVVDKLLDRVVSSLKYDYETDATFSTSIDNFIQGIPTSENNLVTQLHRVFSNYLLQKTYTEEELLPLMQNHHNKPASLLLEKIHLEGGDFIKRTKDSNSVLKTKKGKK